GGRPLVTPARGDHATLMAVKARLDKKKATFLFLNCKMSWRDVVRDLPAKIRFPKCEGLMVAVIAPYEKDKIAKLDLQGTDKESRAKAKRLFTNASLVMAHGRKAVLALMARGVGEDTAARILRGYHETEQDFLRDVLAAEITYARTAKGQMDEAKPEPPPAAEEPELDEVAAEKLFDSLLVEIQPSTPEDQPEDRPVAPALEESPTAPEASMDTERIPVLATPAETEGRKMIRISGRMFDAVTYASVGALLAVFIGFRMWANP